jgi:hypothetical protein
MIDYLGNDLDFTDEGYCKLDMTKYIKKLLLEMKVTKSSHISSHANLFIIEESSPLLSTEDKILFHHKVAKMVYLAKRARGNILTSISFLTTRVLVPMGSGAVHCKSSKQSLVTKSSTEAELVAISDCVSIGVKICYVYVCSIFKYHRT